MSDLDAGPVTDSGDGVGEYGNEAGYDPTTMTRGALLLDYLDQIAADQGIDDPEPEVEDPPPTRQSDPFRGRGGTGIPGLDGAGGEVTGDDA